ncbi:DnaJ domain-containing protein [Kingella negevensis]|uniref:DnaJ domain-containing protein n=1 Tax=Kingella negevensis TaxID=1522312 RepID=UPI00050A31D6|nr:DnaJ domain-containing protein [Kingella negevensis]MDK4687755.1 DnaJ domain-containing protein [Kingella negevensis]WII91250.1 DnaJ domain-containing protein [Kingella negevensis]
MRTHYDNLHVPRNADADTIRKAYRRLSKQYHPDYNPDPNAHRIMQIINRAYEVLSDPTMRARHDLWIREQEALEMESEYQIVVTSRKNVVVSQPENKKEDSHKKRNLYMLIIGVCVILTALLALQVTYMVGHRQVVEQQPTVIVVQPENGTTATVSQAASNVTVASTTPATTAYIRPTTAPNGTPFPQDSSYISGYTQVRSQTGKMRIIVENIRNSSDVFAELYTTDQPQVLRTFFLNERSQFVLDGLDAGTYAIRYRQLDDGEEMHTENISLNDYARDATVYLQRGHAPSVSY